MTDETPRWGYCKDHPLGKIFYGSIPIGWVDTPAKLKAEKPSDKPNRKTVSKKKPS